MTPPPTVTDLEQIYSTNVSEQEKRYTLLEKSFQERFGCNPVFYSRAPGRVNLIGEHIDYSGYGVLPMALDVDSVIASSVSSSDDNRIHVHIRNTSDAKFSEKSYTFDITGDRNPISINTQDHHWTNYVLCGVWAGFGIAKDIKGVVLNYVVDGTVPMGSGLSSSSALVCSATLATCRALNLLDNVTKQQLGQIAADAERYGMSVQIGGMDQAISFLGERNHAQYITFEPKLDNQKVSLPDGVSFVVAHSLVGAHKNESAAHNYNRRVIECRLATAVLTKGISNEVLQEFHTLHWLQEKLNNASFEEMIAHVKQQLTKDSYDLPDVASILGLEESEIKKRYFGSITLANEKEFKLSQRSLHVYTESKRVLDAVKLSQTQDASAAEQFGTLMNESHYSCRDLFECSCNELEQLTSAAREFDGCLGSRLTGAGWGGCCVSLVKTESVPAFCDHIWSSYYQNNENAKNVVRSEVLFASKPATGAVIFQHKQ